LEKPVPGADNLSKNKSAPTGCKRQFGQFGRNGQEYVYQKNFTMKNVKIETLATKATDLSQFKGKNGQRRLGMVYYQALSGTGFIARVITADTNVQWLETAIQQERIFIPCACILAELA
jgi:hypothetical protein